MIHDRLKNMKAIQLKQLLANIDDEAEVCIVAHVPYEVRETKVLSAYASDDTLLGSLVIECEPIEACDDEEESDSE